MKKKSSGKRPGARKLEQRADELLKELAETSRDFAKQGMRSKTLSRAELIRKLSGKTAHSPFLTQIGWGNAVRGQLFGLRFVIMNPDPYPWGDAVALSVYWGAGTGLVEPGDSLQLADPAVGVLAIELGSMNPSNSPYNISAAHVLPAGLAPNSARSEVSYLLYTMNSFAPAPGVLLERGSLSLPVG